MSEKVGRPTELTDEMVAKIKQAILNGNNLKETAKIIDKSYSTLTDWTYRNYSNISDKIEGWKRDYKLKLADINIDKILKLKHDDKDFTKTVADMSKFVKETLDKKNYSKRTENTGADGKDLGVIMYPTKTDEQENTLETT